MPVNETKFRTKSTYSIHIKGVEFSDNINSLVNQLEQIRVAINDVKDELNDHEPVYKESHWRCDIEESATWRNGKRSEPVFTIRLLYSAGDMLPQTKATVVDGKAITRTIEMLNQFGIEIDHTLEELKAIQDTIPKEPPSLVQKILNR